MRSKNLEFPAICRLCDTETPVTVKVHLCNVYTVCGRQRVREPGQEGVCSLSVGSGGLSADSLTEECLSRFGSPQEI